MVNMANVICEKLGIKYPILQGPMAWASDSKLVASVSEAGGLGMLGVGFAPPEVVRAEIEKTKELTKKPFGLNILMFSPCVDEISNIAVESKVKVLAVGAMPNNFTVLPEYIKKWKDSGMEIIGKAASVEEAKAFDKAGVDFISLKGYEGGGHIFGFTGTIALVPEVVDCVSVPIIASSGIADGRGIAAALMLGAKAVELGSRFLLADECPVHENYKEAIFAAKEGDTTLTGVVAHDAVRQLKNQLSDKLLKIEKNLSPEEAIPKVTEIASGSLRRAAVEGEINETGAVLVGQICGMLKKRQSVKVIMEELVKEYTDILKNAHSLL
ncbi:MAG: enoyl-[acyl-carrier-protein] reductase FabK [Firmicutes bacterium]|nr:enoyl-[acyl-carrier-protein] reductase FabK [Bacillota bacterium]